MINPKRIEKITSFLSTVLWLTCFMPMSVAAQTIVIDGDTIKSDGVTYRILGIDTPETFRAKCGSERQAGLQAKLQLELILKDGFSIDARGTDKYRRRLAHLYVGNINVAQMMIRSGHARAYSGRSRREGWC